MADEPNAQVEEQSIPAGEAVSPSEPIAEQEVQGSPAAPVEEVTEQDQELADLQTAVEKAQTPEELKAAKARQNHRWAELRKEAKERREAEQTAARDAAYWKGQAEALKSTHRPAETQPIVPEKPSELVLPPKPKAADFQKKDEYGDMVTDADAFEEAKLSWASDCAVARFQHQQKLEQEQARHSKQVQEQSTWEQTGEDKFPGFKDRIQPIREVLVSIDPRKAHDFSVAVSESEMSHELAVYLADNPKELKRLVSGSIPSALREIGKLELKLAKPEPQKITNAPKPITPVTGTGKLTNRPLEELSMEQYEERRNRELFGPDWKRSG